MQSRADHTKIEAKGDETGIKLKGTLILGCESAEVKSRAKYYVGDLEHV
jgi:hypothetical protein